MATIKMKRGSGVPSGLTAGEPAFDTTAKHYYVHDGSAAQWVGAAIKNNAGATSWADSVYGDTVLATQYAIDQRIASQIAAGGGGFTLAASNGTAQSIVLGSDTLTIAQGDGILTSIGGTDTVTITNIGVRSVSAGTGIAVSGSTGAVTISNTGVQSFNGSTGAVSFVDYVSSFNGTTGAVSFVDYVSGITGTANEIEVTGNTGSVVIGLPSNVTITSNLVVGGNLTVNGTTVTVDSTVVQIQDPVFTLGGTQDVVSSDAFDRGVLFRYGTGSVAKTGFMGWDRSQDEFLFLKEATLASEAVTGGTYGNITANALRFKDTFTNTLSGLLQTTVSGTSKTWTLPNVTGTIITTGDTATVTNDMLAGSIADSKLNQITTANKVALSAIDLDGATETTTIAGTDLLFVDDGAGGTNRKVTVNNLYGTDSTAVIDGGSY